MTALIILTVLLTLLALGGTTAALHYRTQAATLEAERDDARTRANAYDNEAERLGALLAEADTHLEATTARLHTTEAALRDALSNLHFTLTRTPDARDDPDDPKDTQEDDERTDSLHGSGAAAVEVAFAGGEFDQ